MAQAQDQPIHKMRSTPHEKEEQENEYFTYIFVGFFYVLWWTLRNLLSCRCTWGGGGSVCRASMTRGPQSRNWQWRSQGAQSWSGGPEPHLSEPRGCPSEGSAGPPGSSPPICQKLPALSSFLIVDRMKRERDGKRLLLTEYERERES